MTGDWKLTTCGIQIYDLPIVFVLSWIAVTNTAAKVVPSAISMVCRSALSRRRAGQSVSCWSCLSRCPATIYVPTTAEPTPQNPDELTGACVHDLPPLLSRSRKMGFVGPNTPFEAYFYGSTGNVQHATNAAPVFNRPYRAGDTLNSNSLNGVLVSGVSKRHCDIFYSFPLSLFYLSLALHLLSSNGRPISSFLHIKWWW